MSEKITEKAILATLNIGQYTGKKQDKKAERSVENTFNAHDAGTYRKATIAKEALDDVSKLVNEIRTYFYTQTLPWTDEGKRLKGMEGFLEFTAKLREYETLFSEKANQFTANYPDLIEEAKNRLNGLFNPKDYPTPQEIRTKFYFDVHFDPIAENGDIRVDIQQDTLDQLNADLDKRMNDGIAQAMKDPYIRLHDAIKHAQEKLSDPKAIFRDSLIDNIVDLIKILPSLNVTNDPTLDKLREEASEKLTRYDADTLRESPNCRKETADEAEALLKKMEGLY
jgi:hypothetical protein